MERMEKQLTAVEWLIKELYFYPIDDIVIDKFNQAKAMEKEQIIKAYETAMETDIYNTTLKVGKDYYNKTFKSK